MAANNASFTSERAMRRTAMRWSWKLAEISSIRVNVHATFLLLVAWFAVAYWFEVGSAVRVASGVALFLLLFGCVLLHELGHALTAQRFGFSTREITLLPIGGIARLERMPDDPIQSLWITLAGPAVNIVIAAALFVALQLDRHVAAGHAHQPDRRSLPRTPDAGQHLISHLQHAARLSDGWWAGAARLARDTHGRPACDPDRREARSGHGGALCDRRVAGKSAPDPHRAVRLDRRGAGSANG